LDDRRAKNDKTYPVKLRVTYQRKQHYYNTGYWFTKEDYEKVFGDKPRRKFKDLRVELNKMESLAIDLINEMTVFSFEGFFKQFKAEPGERGTLSNGYNEKISSLKKNNQIGTSDTYKFSLKSIQEYKGRNNIQLNEITPTFIEDYKRWMILKKKSNTTIGIYLRCLRCILNDAIKDNILKKDQYPFGRDKVAIPSSLNLKKALELSDIKKIIDYPALEGTPIQRAKDYWIFSYLSNGMNIKDMAELRFKDVDFANERFSFRRSKTIETTGKDNKPISVVILPETMAIIERWGTKPNISENYIFPILKKGMTPQKQMERIRQTIKDINKYVGRIAKETGITKKITTYTARHSFATILLRSNAPLELIRESLGHKDIKTTLLYLGSFDPEVKKDFAMKLIPS
jgi:site-specific recombinase XerD